MGVDGSESQSVAAREALRVLAEVSAEQLAARRWEFQSAAQAAGVSVDEIGAVLNRRPELPRALLVEEREMLVAMLERGDFPGRDELLAQVETVEVVRYCACGCATVDLVVSGAEIPPGALARPIPNEALIESPGLLATLHSPTPRCHAASSAAHEPTNMISATGNAARSKRFTSKSLVGAVPWAP